MATTKPPVIAIVGATGLVGNEMLVVLEERKFPVAEVRLFASQDSVGEVYKFRDDEIAVRLLEEDSFEGVDIALFATSGELAAKFVPLATKAGAVSIDNSSHFRMSPDVPLVVPEVNFETALGKKIIANPNCSTIQLVPVLKAIHDLAGLKHVVVSTYQSVSGAGKAALDEASLIQALLGLSHLVTDCGEDLISVDINPFLLRVKGGVALDGLIVLKRD
jgi:aspartate-semialdehyde dehydrogenase